MARTLYFHIGMGRCGSSAIQGFARQNREILEQSGIALPTSVALGSEVAVKHSGNGTGLALTLRNQPAKSPEAAAAISKAVTHLSALPAANCLLSSEFFYAMPIAQFASLKRALNDAGFRVVVICYIREQREWMISRYGQAVKARKWTRTLEQYMRESFRTETLRYLMHFRPLRDLFGADNLIIRIFERQRMAEGDVCKDFCEVLSIPAARMTFATDDTNASGNLLQIELMRTMNGAPEGTHFKFNNRDFLRTTSDLFTSGQMTSPQHIYRLVQPRVMEKIGAYFKRENESFRAEFFPSIDGPLFADRIPEKYEVIGSSDHVAPDTVILLNEYVNRVLQRQAAPSGRTPQDDANIVGGTSGRGPGNATRSPGERARSGYRTRAMNFLRTFI